MVSVSREFVCLCLSVAKDLLEMRGERIIFRVIDVLNK